jgi:hypothetical protein
MSDENKVYFSATDPEGRAIDLHQDTWYHIKEEHPEIRGTQEVKSTIQKPDLITEIVSRTSLAYTKISRSDLYVNVYAKMDDTYGKGRVSTAYLVSIHGYKYPE